MLLIGALIALGQAGPAELTPEAARKRLPHASCFAVEVSSPQEPGSRPARLPSFSATRIIELRIVAVLRRPAARGILRFKVFTPRGHLYQTVAVPFVVAGREASPQERHVDGSARPVREQPAQPVSVVAGDVAGYRVVAELPVAGTLITTEGLYGRWTVEPWLDGDSRPCIGPRPFLIRE